MYYVIGKYKIAYRVFQSNKNFCQSREMQLSNMAILLFPKSWDSNLENFDFHEKICLEWYTVMDNDYLTSLLVILLTNLLNNHCPWLYSLTFLIEVIQGFQVWAFRQTQLNTNFQKIPKVITYPCSFHAFLSLEGMKNGLKPINAYQSQSPNFRQCWYGSYGTINIAANCTKNWSWTRKILYEETVAHTKKHEICCCQTD